MDDYNEVIMKEYKGLQYYFYYYDTEDEKDKLTVEVYDGKKLIKVIEGKNKETDEVAQNGKFRFYNCNDIPERVADEEGLIKTKELVPVDEDYVEMPTIDFNPFRKGDYIWYVCYGSNMCLERFMCYITGKGSDKYNIKEGTPCKNTNPPKEIRNYELPFQLYFAKHSKKWDDKGVCFVDENRRGKTYARAYLITNEQFDHICNQEGRWYNSNLCLGQIDGTFAFTITNDFRHIPLVDPSDRYLEVIKEGLREMKIDEEEIERYLKEAIDNE